MAVSTMSGQKKEKKDAPFTTLLFLHHFPTHGLSGCENETWDPADSVVWRGVLSLLFAPFEAAPLSPTFPPYVPLSAPLGNCKCCPVWTCRWSLERLAASGQCPTAIRLILQQQE